MTDKNVANSDSRDPGLDAFESKLESDKPLFDNSDPVDYTAVSEAAHGSGHHSSHHGNHHFHHSSSSSSRRAALVPPIAALPAVGLVLLHVQAHLVQVRLARALRVITLQVGTTLLPDVAARAY